jgi:hypothetical protein
MPPTTHNDADRTDGPTDPENVRDPRDARGSGDVDGTGDVRATEYVAGVGVRGVQERWRGRVRGRAAEARGGGARRRRAAEARAGARGGGAWRRRGAAAWGARGARHCQRDKRLREPTPRFAGESPLRGVTGGRPPGGYQGRGKLGRRPTEHGSLMRRRDRSAAADGGTAWRAFPIADGGTAWSQRRRTPSPYKVADTQTSREVQDTPASSARVADATNVTPPRVAGRS